MAAVLINVTDHGTRWPEGAALTEGLLEHGFRSSFGAGGRHNDRWPGGPALRTRQDTELR